MKAPTGRAAPVHELTVSEMFADPIVQKLMDRDGVTRLELEDLMRAARPGMTRQEPENGQSGSGQREMNRQQNGDVMSDRSCLCVSCARVAESSVNTTAGTSGVNHNHARLPSVLRYRGMENEAVMAARLCKVESLIASLQLVLEDLDTAFGAPLGSGSRAETKRETGENSASGQDFRAFAHKQARLLERIFESALLRIRSEVAGSGEHSSSGNETENAPLHETNGSPDFGSAFAEG